MEGQTKRYFLYWLIMLRKLAKKHFKGMMLNYFGIIYNGFILFLSQIPKLISEVHPVSVEVEWVPIVVGALFKMIGSPMVC